MGPPTALSYAKNTAADANNVGLTSTNQGGQLYHAAFPAFQSAIKYFQDLASGNPSTVNAAVAPQVNQINQQYDAATQAAGRNSRRGGAQADATTALQLQRTGQIASDKSSAVASAPTAEASLGETGTQLSQTAIMNALNAFATSGKIDTNLIKPEAQQQGNFLDSMMQIGGTFLGL